MKTFLLIFGILLGLSARADTVLQMNQMVTGSNVYAPSVLFDQQENKYKMWYGGWQLTSDSPHDNIYYRESTNGINWGGYTKVLDHSTYSMFHVNDPTVIKAWNGALNRWMYWMFFTGIACDPTICSITNHHIYAVSGFDGKTWGGFQKVIDGYGTNGVFAPSVVSLNDTNGTFWLYYQMTGVADRIILTQLTAGTVGVSTQEVYVSSFDGAHNPDVSRKPDGTWTMMYNRIDTNNAFHIWKLTSTNGIDWTNDTLILYSGCSPFCVATTPNHRWLNNSNYYLYYGLDETLTFPSAEIHGWKMSE